MTAEQLAACTGCTRVTLAASWLFAIEAAMEAYEINTPQRQSAFLSQIGHESGGLQYSREIWGPTAAQKRYEGRHDLGNTQHGDGERFRGRGLIQVTGRASHARVRDRLRKRFASSGPWVPDFEARPEFLEVPEWAALSAADFWDEHGLNALADAGDFERITRRINGGLNGQADRLERYLHAREVLGC